MASIIDIGLSMDQKPSAIEKIVDKIIIILQLLLYFHYYYYYCFTPHTRSLPVRAVTEFSTRK